MLSSKLTVILFLIAIVVSFIIPNTVLGEVIDFEARIEENWTGHIIIGSASVKVDNVIKVGFEDNAWPASDLFYRGWATFDITDLPSDACVFRIELRGNCNSIGASDHQLSVVSLLKFPPGLTAAALGNTIGTSSVYETCDDCMRTTGTKSVELLGGANSDLEKATTGTDLHWFAVGFRESGENSAPGSWSGVYALEYPTLRVYYSTPVQSAPSIVSSDYRPCVGETYTVSWNSIPGAQNYFIKIGTGTWTSTGGLTSKELVNNSAYSGEIRVRGESGCGSGPESAPITVESIDPPSRPASPIATDTSPCPGDSVTISWPAINGAVKYRLRESTSGKYVYSGTSTSWRTKFTEGSIDFWLSVDNGCQWSDPSRRLRIITKQQLVTPAAPVSDQNPAREGEPFTLSWSAVPDADSYRLWEQGYLIYNDVLPQTTMTLNTSGEYRFSVAAINDCELSATGPELVLIVDMSTAVEEVNSLELPDSYTLSQNYPNPFNPETQIEFSLKRSGRVVLTVYNVKGETVRTLVDEQLSAGHKVVVWDGRDDSMRLVTSGIYLYKLTAGEFVESRKMILLK